MPARQKTQLHEYHSTMTQNLKNCPLRQRKHITIWSFSVTDESVTVKLECVMVLHTQNMCKYAISHDGCVQQIHVTHIKSTNLHTKAKYT